MLTDAELRSLFAANGLELRTAEVQREPRELESYLDLAGREGEARERARALAPQPDVAELGWYVLSKV